MSNVNYNSDILIYPITSSLSDITNTDITSNRSIEIEILSLVNNAGVAIYINDE
jgi:hypothetical protein